MEEIKTDLQFTDDDVYHKRSFIVKRIGMIIMLLFVLGGLSGLFGYAPWTKKKTGNSYAMIEYERFLRATKQTPLKIVITPEPSDTVTRITFNTEYLKKVDFPNITPKPNKTTLEDGKMRFEFASRGRGPHTIYFFSKAFKAGSVDPVITINKQQYSFQQFIYP